MVSPTSLEMFVWLYFLSVISHFDVQWVWLFLRRQAVYVRRIQKHLVWVKLVLSYNVLRGKGLSWRRKTYPTNHTNGGQHILLFTPRYKRGWQLCINIPYAREHIRNGVLFKRRNVLENIHPGVLSNLVVKGFLNTIFIDNMLTFVYIDLNTSLNNVVGKIFK